MGQLDQLNPKGPCHANHCSKNSTPVTTLMFPGIRRHFRSGFTKVSHVQRSFRFTIFCGRNMERWVRKTALVTGAASGIGKAITFAFLRKGINVVALDIDQNKLSVMQNECMKSYPTGTMLTFTCDLSNECDAERVIRYAKGAFDGSLRILVNNVGVIDYSRVIDGGRETFQKLLNINVLTAADFISQFVRFMHGQSLEGHIFNINSVLGHEIPSGSLSEIHGCNGWNLYPACKHATVALTRTVRRELAAIKSPIRITSISPGIVETNISDKTPLVKEALKKIPALKPEDVADAVVYALGTRPEVQITELIIQCTGEA